MEAIEFLILLLLVLHIAVGSLALLSGFLNMVTAKRGKRHTIVGEFFMWSAILSSVLGIVLSVNNGNWFLTWVGIFTCYMAYSGMSYHKNKDLNSAGVALIFITAAFGLFTTGYGLGYFIGGKSFGVVHFIFGLISLLFVRVDLLVLFKKRKFTSVARKQHIYRMTGSFISVFTAFLVVNIAHFPGFVPEFIIWLLPTAAFVPFAVYWSRNQEAKISKL